MRQGRCDGCNDKKFKRSVTCGVREREERRISQNYVYSLPNDEVEEGCLRERCSR